MARVCIFMNQRSGSCMGRREEVEAAFRARGVACEVTLIGHGMDLPALVRQAAAVAGTIVVAAGGDGTVNAVASAVAGTESCMGVLAMGTLNHFAKDLGLPLTVEDGVRAIVDGSPRAVDLGEVNGRVFLNNSSLGFYPGMVLQRERLKRVGWNKWLSLTVASIGAFLRFRHIRLSVATAGARPERIEVRTPFLFIGNNEYCMEGTSAGTRRRLDGGRLYLYMAPGATRVSLLGLTWAAMRHRVREAAHFESLCVEEFTVTLKRRRVRLALDGEVHRVETPLRFRIRPGALHVMSLPAAEAEP